MLPQRGPVTATQKAQVTMYVTVGVTTVFAQVSKQQDLADRTALNLATGKTPCWAGATPVFRLSAVQKVLGVAPARCWFAERACCRRLRERSPPPLPAGIGAYG